MSDSIAKRFKDSHLRSGGVLLVHTSISRTLRETGANPDQVIDALLEAMGPEGTVLFPLFNFDFTSGIAFDIAKTPSQMGVLSNTARQRSGAVRTGHPIYSFAILGARAAEFDGLCNQSAYGADSPFALLREMDAQIGVIDLADQDSMTFYHHVEEILGVPYRYHKDFSAPYTGADGQTEEKVFSIFVRNIAKGVLTSVDRMGERLWEKGLYKGQRPGAGNGLRVIDARALFDETQAVIEQGKAKDYLYDIENDAG